MSIDNETDLLALVAELQELGLAVEHLTLIAQATTSAERPAPAKAVAAGELRQAA
jgi:hypothetical protein